LSRDLSFCHRRKIEQLVGRQQGDEETGFHWHKTAFKRGNGSEKEQLGILSAFQGLSGLERNVSAVAHCLMRDEGHFEDKG